MQTGAVNNTVYNTAQAAASGSTGSSSSTPVNDAMGKDAFLKLLVTQLQNQDPLKPADNTEFVAQLAQFSSLEGINNLNTSMDGMSKSMAAMQGMNTTNLVGRYARTEGNTFKYITGNNAQFGYTLSAPAASVKVAIADAAGRVVKDIDMGTESKGDQLVSWDGKDNSGAQLPAGAYSFKVTAVDSGNNTVLSTPYALGLISSVSLDNGNATLKVDGQPTAMDMIKEIY